MLSFRFKTNDHFWFSLFHELGHLLLHGKKLLFLEGWAEGLQPELEAEADRWAASLLIPASKVKALKELARTEKAILNFADELGIAAGIVVGRLQHEKHLRWDQYDNLKLHYAWSEE